MKIFKDKDELLKYCIDEGMTEQRAKIYELIKNSEKCN